MKEIKLRMREQRQYEVVKELVDHGGNKKRAAIKLGISLRQLNRMILKYKNGGKASFIHGNRGKSPKNKLDSNISNTILTLYTTKYKCGDKNLLFNFQHFKEMLEEIEGIVVSRTTISNILYKNGIISPLAHRVTKKRLKRQELEKQKMLENKTENEIEEIINHQISMDEAHPRKERCKYFGEQIEMDASSMNWFGEGITHLHLAIDNATGTIVGAYFDTQETLNGYYHVFKQILENYGIPLSFLTDKRTVFTYESCKKKDENKDVLTQFGYACQILGTELKCSSVAQAKGKVERANGTYQRRLANELKLSNITTIEDANNYLINVFVPKFNKKFALDYTKIESAFDTSPDNEKINQTLAVIHRRKIDTGNAIAFNNKYYLPAINGQKVFFMKKTICLVIKTFDGKVVVSIDDKIYEMLQIDKPKEKSENFDIVTEEENNSYKPKYAPPASHPWKKKSYEQYLKTTRYGVAKQQAGLLC